MKYIPFTCKKKRKEKKPKLNNWHFFVPYIVLVG